MRSDFADATRDIFEINSDGDVVRWLFKFDIRIAAANRLTCEWQNVKSFALAIALEEEIFAIGRPGRLAVIRIKMGYVDGSAAGSGNNPNVPCVTLAAIAVCNPLHVGRPCEISATNPAPLGTGNMRNPARLA